MVSTFESYGTCFCMPQCHTIFIFRLNHCVCTWQGLPQSQTNPLQRIRSSYWPVENVCYDTGKDVRTGIEQRTSDAVDQARSSRISGLHVSRKGNMLSNRYDKNQERCQHVRKDVHASIKEIHTKKMLGSDRRVYGPDTSNKWAERLSSTVHPISSVEECLWSRKRGSLKHNLTCFSTALEVMPPLVMADVICTEINNTSQHHHCQSKEENQKHGKCSSPRQ